MTGVPVPIGSCRRNRVLAMGALVALSLQPGLRGSQQQPFVERVDVARILFDARVFDDNGKPVRDLTQSDFAVTIDGHSARVESIEWVGGRTSSNPLPLNAAAFQQHPHVSGRLIVFFVQMTLMASPAVSSRDLAAMIRALQLTDPLLAGLTPEDRVAVLSFDSRLNIWSDFNNDFNSLCSAHVR